MCCERLPDVSVIMGVRYLLSDVRPLRRAVQSILEQTYEDFEFLICDDGSTYDASSYLDSIAAKDNRIRLIRGCKPTDLASKLNFCLAAAKGSSIARMDDDDYSHPDRLEKQLLFLNTYPDTAFVGCCVSLVRNGVLSGTKRFPERPCVEDFYFSQPYIHPALMFRREALERVDGYSEHPDCLLCEDYDLLLRLYQAGFTGANLQEILFDYTIPVVSKGNRRMKHRINEVKTRYHRFRDLGRLPRALPYVVKPVVVGLIPEPLLAVLKQIC